MDVKCLAQSLCSSCVYSSPRSPQRTARRSSFTPSLNWTFYVSRISRPLLLPVTVVKVGPALSLPSISTEDNESGLS